MLAGVHEPNRLPLEALGPVDAAQGHPPLLGERVVVLVVLEAGVRGGRGRLQELGQVQVQSLVGQPEACLGHVEKPGGSLRAVKATPKVGKDVVKSAHRCLFHS